MYHITEVGHRTAMINFPNRPSGLGFLPDGTPLTVAIEDRRVFRLVDGALELHADLRDSAR